MQDRTTLAEQEGGLSAQTDSRGIYLDENEEVAFPITVYRSGVPAPGCQVLVAKYDNNLGLIAAGGTRFVNFTHRLAARPVRAERDRPADSDRGERAHRGW